MTTFDALMRPCLINSPAHAAVRPPAPEETARTASSALFQQLVALHYRRAYFSAYQLMNNVAEAEDLTQEAFVRAWAAFDTYDRTRPFEGWLFRILSNLAIDRWRRISHVPICSLDAPASSAGSEQGGGRASLAAVLADERPSAQPEQACLRAERATQMRQALKGLPHDYREAVLLADVAGYSYEEIAQRVGCPVGTVRSRLHRGRQLLRKGFLKLESV
jgi:RNA polymerase sigma-70 factor (ECF subfamily)